MYTIKKINLRNRNLPILVSSEVVRLNSITFWIHFLLLKILLNTIGLSIEYMPYR